MNKQDSIRRVSVFCGSCIGNIPAYEEAAKELGKLLALEDINLIYGGGGIGLMRTVADAVLQYGGTVTGVLPCFFDRNEVAHNNITEMIIVRSMGERKEKMAELSDAFIILPGGYGTMDELFEVAVYSQLGLQSKTVAILNTNHFYDPLFCQLDRMQEDGFLYPVHRNILIDDTNPAALVQKIIMTRKSSANYDL
ncbi:MAG: TIGR00730 family Rossman fold protein [Bacteroidales bacterium]|jgi:uncharacterized protein (TIGR00730 family)|nr:TIGR00730 family Rossman fold protein [Bacteroidales bacterium]